MSGAGHRARRRLAQRRKVQGFTQETLAARLEVERSTVVRWEAGKSEPQAGMRPKLADALQVTADQLADLLTEGSITTVASSSTVIPYSDDARYLGDSSGIPVNTVFQLRRVLMGGISDTPPRTQPELTAAVAHAWDLFFSARFGEMEQMLPFALTSALNTAEATTGKPRRQVNIALAQLLHASSNLLGYIAQEDLAALALLRADNLAAESGDELTRAAIKGSHSWLLAKGGMYDDAAAYAEHAAAEIEPRLSTATPRHVSIWGELLCYAALAASRAGDHRQARQYLRLCESAGKQLEDEYATRPEASNVFGRTSAASFGVINETEANRPQAALELAALASGGGTGIPPTLLSRRLINVAQAQLHNRDDAEAVATLRRACSTAPEFVRHIPLAHTLVDELLARRGRQRLAGLVDVAEHLRVPVQPVGIRL
ncbi:helix-turn-helix domain-containing protein [Nocardia asiatica]